ncbi:MAG: tandem-95 repeat protein [Verrucomicrobiae bacterium]|nr:tandem-95 repeat protein [Verrucomicrobiae bacterium]
MSTPLSRTRRSLLLAWLGTLLTLAGIASLHAETIRLEWDPNTESNIGGYRVYCGAASATYDTVIDVGNQTHADIADLLHDRTYYFVVTAYDITGLESPPSNEVFHKVAKLNLPPSGSELVITLAENGSASFTLSGSDPDGDPIDFAILTTVKYGTLSGSLPLLTYTPFANFHGTDAFTYVVSDGHLTSDPITVTFQVTKVNKAPVASNLAVSTPEATPVSFTLAGSDPDGDPITYKVEAAPKYGSLSGSAPNLTYTPAAGFHGSDFLTFSVSDGKLTSTHATVSISVSKVNQPPVAHHFKLTLDSGSSAPVTLQGTDPDGDPLVFVITRQPTYGVILGTPPNIIYQANAGYSGSDSIRFTVSDGEFTSAPATGMITILAVNQAPVASNLAVSTLEDGAVSFTLAGSDPDGDAITYKVESGPKNGSLSGSAPNLTYTPTAGFHGSDSLTFSVSDGKLTSAHATVSITVTKVNKAPVASNLAVSTPEDSPVSFTLTASDPDGDPITYKIESAPKNGSTSGTAPNLTYTPKPGFHGSDSLTFSVSDGKLTSAHATVSITVTKVNKAPVAYAATVATEQGASVAVTLKGSDPDGDAITFKTQSGPAKGTLTGTAPNLTYTPNSGFHGSDEFTFTVSDGSLTSAPAKISITVIRTATPPVAHPDGILVAQGASSSILVSGATSVLANDTDASGVTAFATLKTPPVHGAVTLAANGTFTYRHFGGTDLADTFTYTASNDSGESAEAVVHVRVLQVAAIRTLSTGAELEFAVTQGIEYTVECQNASPGAIGPWAVLTRFTATTDGFAAVTDPAASTTPNRLYRVRSTGAHGDVTSEPWGYMQMTLNASGAPLTSPFTGSIVRRAQLTARGASWIRLEGAPWADKQLSPHRGLASHIAVVVASANPAAVGRSWTVRLHDDSTIALNSGTENVAHVLQVGDVVEIQTTITIASLFGVAGSPNALLKQNDTVTIHAMEPQEGWTLRYSVARNSAAGYYMSTPAGMVGPFDGTTLYLLPGQSFSPPSSPKSGVKAIGSGRIADGSDSR